MAPDYDVLGYAEGQGFRAELREYCFTQDVEFDRCYARHTISYLVPTVGSPVQTQWIATPGAVAMRPIRFALLPQGRHFHATCSPGRFRSMVCGIDAAMFERATGIKWLGERELALIMALKGPMFDLVFTRMVREIARPGIESTPLISHLLGCLMLGVSRALNRDDATLASEPGLAEWQLRRTLAKIGDFAGDRQEIHVEALAAMCGISARHFMRGFKASTGCTVYKYIEKSRLEHACALMREDALPFKAVAAHVGYSSAAHLTMAFKRLRGETPSEFRRNARPTAWRMI